MFRKYFDLFDERTRFFFSSSGPILSAISLNLWTIDLS